MPHFRPTVLAAICSLMALSMPGQAPVPAPRTADAVIRVSVNLVEVDALVTDSKGRHVGDLKPEDFTILEDGKPQKITQFAYVNPAPEQVAATTPDKSAPAGETKFAPPAGLRREDVHRTIVLMIDNLHTHTDSIGSLEPIVKKFVDDQVVPGDLVSVMATKSGMGIYENFTSDKRQLEAAVARVLRMPGDNRPQESGFTDPNSGNPVKSDSADDSLYFTDLYHELAMNTLSRAIEALKDIPGRKAVVFFSDGIMIPAGMSLATSDLGFRMSERTKAVTQLANRYGVTLYTFDPGGLMTPMSLTRPMGGIPSGAELAGAQGRTPTGGSRSGGVANTSTSQQRGDAMALNEISSIMASETGGTAIHNTNDLSAALGKAMDDMTGYYLMAYQPQRKDGESVTEEREHRLHVKVHRSGLTVRSRKGYAGLAADTAEKTPTREEQLGKALFSPFVAGGVGVHLTPLYSASAPDPRTNRRQPLLRVALAVDGKDLRFKNSLEGGKQAILDVLVAAFDAAGHQIASQDKRYTVQGTSEQAAAFAGTMLDYQLEVPIPGAGAFQVRAAVRDDATGKLGSANTFLLIPDYNKPQLTLSSLVLGDPKGGKAEIASRQFNPGSQLSYGCQVFGAQSADSGSSVEIEVKLFHDGKQVYASNPMPIKPPAGMKEIPVAGKLNLLSTFAAGDYAMEFIARDNLATTAKPVIQWSDFSIAGSSR